MGPLRGAGVNVLALQGGRTAAHRFVAPVQHFCHHDTAVGSLLQGLRILAEKVVHHPTIIAGHAEGRRWTLDADSDLRSKFWGRSIELMPVGAHSSLKGGHGVLGAPAVLLFEPCAQQQRVSLLQAPFGS
jgi:Oxysterol-binding protein